MKYTAGFIGIGNMGGALLSAVCSQIGAEAVAMYDISEEKLTEKATLLGTAVCDLDELTENSKYIFLGVKPNVISTLLSRIKGKLKKDTVLVSMAAGVSVMQIREACGHEKIIRIMPNTPVSAGEGMILYCFENSVSEVDENGFLNLLAKAGRTDKIDEKYIDAAAALSGCGPAFVYMFIDALCDGAVKCGLNRAQAMLYAEQTVLGAAALAIRSGKHPAELKDAVCSPGGTTIEGVISLENGAFRGCVADAVVAAYEKTSKLKK